MRNVCKLLFLAWLLVAAPGLTACGGGDATCTSDTDCAAAEECLWVTHDGRSAGKMCSVRCTADSECPPGATCSGEAHACPTCKDFIQVCE